MLRKIILWAVVVVLAFYMITQPHGATNVIENLLHLLQGAGNSLVNFTESL